MDGTMPTSFGRDDADDRDEQRPGDARHERRDHVGDGLDVRRVVAEEAHPLLGVAAGHQQLAVAAHHELADQRDHRQQHARGDEEQHLLVHRVVEVEPEEAAEVVQARGAAGRRLVADEQDREGRGQRLRQDREVGAADPAAEGREAEQARRRARAARGSPGSSPRADRNGSHQPGTPSEEMQGHEVGGAAGAGVGELEVHRHQVGADAEEHALPERQHAAPAPGQPDPDGDHRVAEVLAEQVEPERRQQRRARRRTAARRRSRSRRAPPTGT